jgi:hypothetical protein
VVARVEGIASAQKHLGDAEGINLTMRTIFLLLTGFASLGLAVGCRADNPHHLTIENRSSEVTVDNELIEVAISPQYQWNGVAVSLNGRVFASFPRWLGDETISVGEIFTNGTIKPFPGGDWNAWSPLQSPENPANRFVSVNAVFADQANNLWVVDPAAPDFISIQSCRAGRSWCKLT